MQWLRLHCSPMPLFRELFGIEVVIEQVMNDMRVFVADLLKPSFIAFFLAPADDIVSPIDAHYC